MRTPLLLLLCLSVLLSGCITTTTAIFEPEPNSGGDWCARLWGGLADASLATLATYIAYRAALGGLAGSSVPKKIWIGTVFGLMAIPCDVAIANSLRYRQVDYIPYRIPYRKGYYKVRPRKQKPPEDSPELAE